MTDVVVDISMSLDGFVAGPDDGLGRGLGEGGEPIHDWVMGGPWTYDGGTPFRPSGVDKEVGIESALAQACEAAGDKDVSIGGGARVVQQFLAAGLVDAMQIHLAPVLVGEGTRLFDHLGPPLPRLEQVGVRHSPYATHIRYRVENTSR
jgi:dihydrofolate reductase